MKENSRVHYIHIVLHLYVQRRCKIYFIRIKLCFCDADPFFSLPAYCTSIRLAERGITCKLCQIYQHPGDSRLSPAPQTESPILTLGCLFAGEIRKNLDWLGVSFASSLQSGTSNCGHPTKFLTTSWHLFRNFLMASHCIWPIKMQGLWLRSPGVRCRKAKMALDNSTSPSSRILFGQFKWKPQQVVKKMLQSYQPLIKNFVGGPWLHVLDCNTFILRVRSTFLWCCLLCCTQRF